MDSIAKQNQQGNRPAWKAALHERGLSDDTIAYFGIQSAGGYLCYPTAPDSEIQRFKALPGQGGPKYLWGKNGKPQAGVKPAQVPFYDPRGELAQHVADADGVLILAEGEADVWLLHEAGIYNATCTMLGAGKVYAYHVELLHTLGVHAVRLWPDLDAAGLNHAVKVHAMLIGSEIGVDVYELPSTLGEGSDIGTLALAVGSDNLRAALMSCPYQTLPEPEQPKAQPVNLSALPSDPDEKRELERRERLAIVRALVPHPNGKPGDFICPEEHRHGPKVFKFNPEPGTKIGGCMGKHNTRRLVDIAALVGVDYSQIAREVHAEFHPVSDRVVRGDLSAAPTSDPTRFEHGIPHTLAKRFLNAGLHAAYMVYENYQHATTPDGTPAQLSELQGDLTRRTFDKGLEQLTNVLNIVRFATHTLNGSYVVLQNVHNSPGKPGRRPIFLPLADQLARLEAFFVNQAHERRHSDEDAPSDVLPDFADPAFTPEECTALDAARADAYTAHADQRERARLALERDLRYIAADFERIRQGRYQAFDTPQGVTSVAALKKALYTRTLDENPDGIESYKLRQAAGVSRSYACRARKERSIVLPQFDESPVSAPHEISLGKHQRAELVGQGVTLIVDGAEHAQSPEVRDFLARHKTAVLRKSKPSIEKRRDRATEQELADYQAYRESKIRAAQSGGGGAAQRERVLHPSGFSEAWLARQLAYTPGANDLDRYDPDTGETYTAPHLWRALADKLAGEQGKGEQVATFAAHSEPRERDEAWPVAAEQTSDTSAARAKEDQGARTDISPASTSRPVSVWRPARRVKPGDGFWLIIDEWAAEMAAAGR